MDNILTLIAGSGRLDESAVSHVQATLLGAGGDVAAPDWLSYGKAVDLRFGGLGCRDGLDLAYESIEDSPIDAVTQPAAGRRKRMLIADMESTIIENEMLDELADEVGQRDHISAITARAMNGEIDFYEALRERVALLAGLDADVLEHSKAKIRITPGAKALVATMRANGAYCALVSGGFTCFTAFVQETLTFDMHQSNRLEVENGKLAGTVADPILGPDAKRERLLALCTEHTIPVEATIAVGDGANDLGMLAEAGIGVAYHAKPVVARSATARIDHSDLTALLYLQGYRDEEIVG